MTERVSVRCSVVYASGVDDWTCVLSFSSSMLAEESAERVFSLQRSVTSASIRAFATVGQMVDKRDSWTMSVSAALHAAG